MLEVLRYFMGYTIMGLFVRFTVTRIETTGGYDRTKRHSHLSRADKMKTSLVIFITGVIHFGLLFT